MTSNPFSYTLMRLKVLFFLRLEKLMAVFEHQNSVATGSEVPQCCLLLLRMRIWFLVQKIQSWCELSNSWLTLKPLRSQWFYLRGCFFFCRGQQQAQGAGSYSPISFCFVSFCVNPGKSAWCSSSLCLSLLPPPYVWCILFYERFVLQCNPRRDDSFNTQQGREKCVFKDC